MLNISFIFFFFFHWVFPSLAWVLRWGCRAWGGGCSAGGAGRRGGGAGQVPGLHLQEGAQGAGPAPPAVAPGSVAPGSVKYQGAWLPAGWCVWMKASACECRMLCVDECFLRFSLRCMLMWNKALSGNSAACQMMCVDGGLCVSDIRCYKGTRLPVGWCVLMKASASVTQGVIRELGCLSDDVCLMWRPLNIGWCVLMKVFCVFILGACWRV